MRIQGVIGTEDRKWFESEAMPATMECGLKKAGVVFDGNALKKYYINLLLQNFWKQGVSMKFFLYYRSICCAAYKVS